MATRLTVVAVALISLTCPQWSAAQPLSGYGSSLTPAAPQQSWTTIPAPQLEPLPVVEGYVCPCRPSACCPPNWSISADFLYLRPGNDKLAYGVPINGAIVPPSDVAPVQIAREGVVDHDFQPAFRVGFRHALDDCATVGASCTYFDGTALSELHEQAPHVIRALIVHPGTVAASSDFLNATARSDIQFRLADVDYRRIVFCDQLYAVDFLIGCRYTDLKQRSLTQFSNSTTRENVATQIDFEGGGLRLGLDAERHACGSGWMLYGQGAASFVGGTFNTGYQQTDNFRGTVVNTGWKEDRIITLLDLELGFGWTSSCGRFRATAGYMVNTWLNVLGTSDFIQAVQHNTSSRSTDLTNTLTFDGFVAHIEYRF